MHLAECIIGMPLPQVAPNEIYRIDKFEGSSATTEEGIEELNHELIENNNQPFPVIEKVNSSF